MEDHEYGLKLYLQLPEKRKKKKIKKIIHVHAGALEVKSRFLFYYNLNSDIRLRIWDISARKENVAVDANLVVPLLGLSKCLHF